MKRLFVQPGFFLLLGLMFFFLDPAVSLSVLLSAAIHEAGHLAAIYVCGGRLRTLCLGLTGAEIRYDRRRISYRREALCALAGPFVNILLAAALSAGGWRWGMEGLFIPAGTSLVQGLFNLLPARSLDGGRAIYMLSCARRGIDFAEKSACILSCLTALGILCLGAALLWKTGRNFTLLLIGAGLLLGEIRRLTNRDESNIMASSN